MTRQRLNDREQRNNKSLNRKQVFLVEENSQYLVEIQFGRSYVSLFEKTVNAFTQVPQQYIGELLNVNQENLTLQVSYLGEALKPTPSTLRSVVEFLKKLQNIQIKQNIFTTPRYISSLYEQTNDQKIKSLISYLDGSSFLCATGYGIDDPVISNFTEDDNGVHLIDLDHFAHDISLYYQIGFACADIDIISNQEYKLTNNLYKTFTDYDGPISEGNMATLICGYISRLAIDVINDKLDLDSYRSRESLEHIYKLSDTLMS